MKTGAKAKRLALGLAAGLALSLAPAQAQDFFAGKQVTYIVGSSTGGGYDSLARLTARHLGKHLPGNPQVVPSNMPGAGGGVVASHVYTRAPKDGTFVGVVFPSVIVDPLLSESLRRNSPALAADYAYFLSRIAESAERWDLARQYLGQVVRAPARPGPYRGTYDPYVYSLATASRLAIRSYTRSVLSAATGAEFELADVAQPWAVVVPIVVGLAALALATLRLGRMDVA